MRERRLNVLPAADKNRLHQFFWNVLRHRRIRVGKDRFTELNGLLVTLQVCGAVWAIREVPLELGTRTRGQLP